MTPVQSASASPALTYVTKHTKVVRRQQRIAKGLIWGAAGVTIAMLVLIVGYIVVNGFYQRTVRDYPVTPFEEMVVPVDGDVGLSVVVENSMRIQDVTYPVLRDMFTDRLPYLGYLTTQDRRLTAIVYSGNGFDVLAQEYLLPEGRTFTDFGDSIQIVDSIEAINGLLSENDGAVALVPSSLTDELSAGKTVPVRQTSVVVHPQVLELQAGRRLNELSLTQVEGLFSGEITSWADVGGPGIVVEEQDLDAGIQGEYSSLAPVPVVPAQDSQVWDYSSEIFDHQSFEAPQSQSITAASLEAYVDAIRTTPGSIGVLRTREALAYGLPIVDIERIDHSANLRPSLLFEPPSRAGAVGGLSYIIINTLVLVVFVISIATPIGVSAAIFLVEYSRQGRFVYLLRLGTDTLAGIPSIIFGLFGMVFFSQFLGLQTGLVSGALTLTLMILPTVVRTSEEALKSVPRELRDGSLSLGATKLQTIFRVVLPAASPGILTGVILGIGRAVGETAAILYTLGSNLALVQSINSPIRVLSVHLYLMIRENVSIANAFAAATILVFIVFLVNYTTTRLIGRLNRMAGH